MFIHFDSKLWSFLSVKKINVSLDKIFLKNFPADDSILI